MYKSIINIPGHIVECGVFKGSSIVRFATFREMLENPNSRKIIGFDAFGGFPQQERECDKAFIEKFEREAGRGITLDELNEVFKHKQISNYEMVKGDVLQTVPEYVSNHPELKIALLHLDLDVYNPTKIALECLFNKVVKKGLVVFDDYGTVEGATTAVDEYFAKNSIDLLIEKSSISHIPAYVRKI